MLLAPQGQTYAISHRAETGENKPPIHIVGCGVKLEQRPPSGNPRLSAHALVQEYLNRTEHLWAVVTNGLRWRLLRDTSLMTRLTYIEFDLEQILNGENFAEFGLFYRLFHRSRLPEGMDDADKCLLEFYHQEAIQQGGRVRDRLRDGVEKALELLGTGFLQHPQNEALREKVRSCASAQSEEIALKRNYELDYYRQLLLLIYRLLFLMVAESRNLLFVEREDFASPEKTRIYQEYYSIERLRMLAERPKWRREGFQDLWQGLRVTFMLFDENWRGKLLGLSPLNGDLFGSNTLVDLDNCAIDNYDLLQAIRHLSLYEKAGQLRRVNYAALDVEELGSVYESLLDFHPQIRKRHGMHEFVLALGSDRKTTGSYYTPPQLVGQLIKTALEPVIAEKVRSCALAQSGEDALKRNYEQALLSLKIIDPACGSGHFLLAAARRLGKELARIRTGEVQSAPETLRQAIRDVIQNCIYGVDLNPLAVDLCKVALWIEGFSRGLPLNFLDHRIKCGNSLVGVLDLNCLDEGIPDEAFKPVTGDDKKLASSIKKENKKQRQTDLQGQLSLDLYGNLQQERTQYVEEWQELAEFSEETTADVRRKQEKYQQNRQNTGWWRDFSACNLWTAAFFMGLTQDNLQLLPTTEALSRVRSSALAQSGEDVLKHNYEQSIQNIVDAANKLGEEKRFFHWCLEFPEVFEQGGFDCVLGNPPWERIKLQEKEFFASRDEEIATAANKAARNKLIKGLVKKNPQLAQEWEEAKHDADAQGKFIRESGRFPLTAVGDINTYAVFAETTRKLISGDGRVGVIVPTGIATDDTCKKFFSDLVQKQNLASLYDFENREAIFTNIHRSYKFSQLAISSKPIKQADFAFFLTQPKQLDNQSRQFQLSPQDIKLINPNTLTCPIFRTSADAKLTKKIYQYVPVLENEQTGSNPWGISFKAMFHMANDSGLFHNQSGDGLVPLYEAKMFHQFDHRWATYKDSNSTRDLNDEEKFDSSFQVQPRYWVSYSEVDNKLGEKWNQEWLLGFRDICRSTDERTAIFSLLPKVAINHKAPLIFSNQTNAKLYCLLLSNFNSLVLDYVARQKVGGTSLSFFILRQLPILPPESYTEEDIEFISTRVLELVYTAWDTTVNHLFGIAKDELYYEQN
ncbi:MAG: N-6 DNA methylase [Cyanobacteria bacterium P01_D01_bin.50]